MSTATIQLWRQYSLLPERERREFVAQFRKEEGRHPELEELFPQAPAGSFAGIDSPEEIAQLNRLAKDSAVEITDVE